MVMVDMVDMEVMDTVIMERERLMLSLATTMVAMVMATMERGKPKQLPLLSHDTITMDTAIMEVTDTVIMERERLMLSLATTIMAMAIMDMVDMVMATMERGKLLLSQDTITMDTAIMEVMDTAIMEREADAEPGYYHHGYGHHGYGGYGHGYYGKREAEATAAAEPGYY